MDLKEMMVTIVYQSKDGMVPLDIVEALGHRFGFQTTSKQVMEAVRRNPKLFVESEGRVIRPSGSGQRATEQKTSLTDMIVALVYQNPAGMVPLDIVQGLDSQYEVQTSAKKVLQVVREHPRLFVEKGGRVMRSSDSSGEGRSSKMSLRDMMVTLVYESQDGMTPIGIVDALGSRFQTQVSTKEVLQTVRRSPNLFVEKSGKVMRSALGDQ